MANTFFKSFAESDRTTSRTLLHEAIPITGSIISGTYDSNSNIKTFSHGMFKSIYDYPYLSSSANHIFDVSYGYSTGSEFYATDHTQNSKKLNMYNQMAQVLMGYDATGSIREFDEDGDLSSGGTKLKEVVFFNFARLLQKDEIKKGSFELEFGVEDAFDFDGVNFTKRVKAADLSGSTSYLVNSPAGDYGILYATSSTTDGTT